MLPKTKKPSKAVSERMRRIKSSWTSLERHMAEILRELRVVYLSQPDIFGKPDFAIKGTRLLVFCDSSFWHGRRSRDTSGSAFKTNRLYWSSKLLRNRRRDFKVNRVLRAHGWSVARIWDDDILGNPQKVKSKIGRMIRNAKSKGTVRHRPI